MAMCQIPPKDDPRVAFLEEKVALYEELLLGVQSALFEVTADGVIVALKCRGDALFGYAPSELMGTAFLAWVDNVDKEAALWAFTEMMRARVRSFEFRVVAKDGQITWVRAIARPLLRERVCVGLIGSLEEITDLKEAAQSLERLLKVVAQAAESFVITDAQGQIVYANRATTLFTGYLDDELSGKNIFFFKGNLIAQEDADAILLRLKEAESWQGRVKMLTKEGVQVVGECTISAIKSVGGAVESYAIITKDVTEDVRNEERVRQAQKMEAIGTLAGGIAHDFNNLLFPIMGYAELTLEDPLLPQSSVEGIRTIFEASKRAKGLIQQILAFSRKSGTALTPITLDSVVKEGVTLMRASLPATVTLEQQIERVPSVMADVTQVHQVVINLCTNAWQAMENSGGTICVTLGVTTLETSFKWLHPQARTGSFVKLTVEDTGPGIPKEVMERIFEPYYSTKAPDRGTGLGLAVVDGIVKAHGGFIVVESVPGEGTTFEVYFPLPDRAQSDEYVKFPTGPYKYGSGNILVVDDEPLILKVITVALTKSGYRVTSFTSPEKAFAAYCENPGAYDLLLTDMTMPGMTGDQLAHEVKARRDIPVVIMTGFSTRIDTEKAKSMGITQLLYKPFTKKLLTKKLHEILGHSGTPPAGE